MKEEYVSYTIHTHNFTQKCLGMINTLQALTILVSCINAHDGIRDGRVALSQSRRKRVTDCTFQSMQPFGHSSIAQRKGYSEGKVLTILSLNTNQMPTYEYVYRAIIFIVRTHQI